MLGRRLMVILSLVAMAALVGCEKKVQRYHVWGKITYEGKPIPAGSVHFDPDIAQGGTGPQGFAIIKNGEYDTRIDGGLAPIGGKYVARIYAADGNAQPELPLGRPLFPERSIPKELPKQDSELNIDVPKL